MKALHQLECEACRGDAPRVMPEHYDDYRPALPEWQIVNPAGIDTLQRTFTFKDFKSALAFADQVGNLAESIGHHPSLLVEWGKVTVSWWTHKIGGLHINDFIMAAKTDQLLDHQS